VIFLLYASYLDLKLLLVWSSNQKVVTFIFVAAAFRVALIEVENFVLVVRRSTLKRIIVTVDRILSEFVG